VKRLHHQRGKTKLMPANDEYPTLDITDNMDFHIAGVVVKIVRSL